MTFAAKNEALLTISAKEPRKLLKPPSDFKSDQATRRTGQAKGIELSRKEERTISFSIENEDLQAQKCLKTTATIEETESGKLQNLEYPLA